MLPSFTPPIDYREGTWTPALTFSTPGDVNVPTPTATGFYRKINNLLLVNFTFAGTVLYTTASGNLQITGLPFGTPAGALNNMRSGVLAFNGITKAGYTEFVPIIATTGVIAFIAHGSGVAGALVSTPDIPNNTSVDFRSTFAIFL